MRFTTDMVRRVPCCRLCSHAATQFHPNVYGDGSLCLDIIQDKWSPIYSVSSILTSIQVRPYAER